MKRRIALLLTLTILMALMAGCAGKAESAETTVPETTTPVPETTVAFWDGFETITTKYILGYWGEQMVRSNGYTYPYMFYEPLSQCQGFTLEYEIRNVSEGDLKGNFRYEIYTHEVDGVWESYQVVELEESKMTMEIRFEEPKDIDGVAVVCGKKGDVAFEFDIKVRDPF